MVCKVAKEDYNKIIEMVLAKKNCQHIEAYGYKCSYATKHQCVSCMDIIFECPKKEEYGKCKSAIIFGCNKCFQPNSRYQYEELIWNHLIVE